MTNTMRALTQEEIEVFANRSGVKATPVWNFLGTAHHCGNYVNAILNLDMDAKLYKWNAATVTAIKDGLKLLK